MNCAKNQTISRLNAKALNRYLNILIISIFG